MSVRIARRMEGVSPFYVMELLQRAKELEEEGRDIIHMEIGEPDLPAPNSVINASLKYINEGDIKYTAAPGVTELRQKIAELYKKRYDVDISFERIFITPGASGAFLLALGVSLNEGKDMLMADPSYPCNSNFVKIFGGNVKLINVNESTDYQLSADLTRKNWNENSQGVLVASPSNPTGTLIPELELEKIIQQVNKLGGQFYSDEIYHGLVYGQKAHSALEYSDDVFVINSFSKYFSMTGWRIGWLIVPEEFIDPTERLAQNIFISTATHSQYAALAALEDDNLIELEKRKQVFETRRDFLYQHLLRLGFDVLTKPEGAFYIYVNCSKFTDDSFQFAKDLLEQEGVGVTPGKDFGNYKANCHIRFSYTASIAKMTDAIERLERFLCQ